MARTARVVGPAAGSSRQGRPAPVPHSVRPPCTAIVLVALLCWFSLAATVSVEPVAIGYLSQTAGESPRSGANDEGIAGARLAISDNETTGRFVGLSFVLNEHRLNSEADALQQAISNIGSRFIVTDLPAMILRDLAAQPAARE